MRVNLGMMKVPNVPNMADGTNSSLSDFTQDNHHFYSKIADDLRENSVSVISQPPDNTCMPD